MINNIKDYPNYYWDGEHIWNIYKGSKVRFTVDKGKSSGYVRVVNFEGKRKRLSKSQIEFLTGRWDIPDKFSIVPHTKGKVYINTEGVLYSCSVVPYGKLLQISVRGNKYPTTDINYKGKSRSVEVHQLMCVTFYDKDYVEKGLVCLHKDNNKSNYKLSNLKVGTYSENNKQAYDDGINEGNKYGVRS